MGALADAVYQRTIDDYESSLRREKVRKFLIVGAGVAMALGMGFVGVKMVNDSNHFNTAYQSRLQYMSTHPFIYDGGTVAGCKIQYIATAQENSNGGFTKANYMKSDCDGHVSINRIKQRIIHNRSKLLNDEKELNTLLSIK